MPTMEHELALVASGCRVVAGVDEAGRGPLAGPVSVAAVVLPEGFEHPVLNDSKKLTEPKREMLYEEITQDKRVRWCCVLVGVAEIDRLNILGATHEGMRRAVNGLGGDVDGALIDGLPVRDFPVKQVALVKGDSLSFSIAAASVIAKVTRDRLMVKLAAAYPGYGFEVHKGYPTKMHFDALQRLGSCPEHRRSFGPVAQLEVGV
jgi:ribonuclease HII